MLGRDCNGCRCRLFDATRISTEVVEPCRENGDSRRGVRVIEDLGQSVSFVRFFQRLLRKSKKPQRPGGMYQAYSCRVVTIRINTRTVLLSIIDADRLFEVFEGIGNVTCSNESYTQNVMRFDAQIGVVCVLGQPQAVFRQASCLAMLAACRIEKP